MTIKAFANEPAEREAVTIPTAAAPRTRTAAVSKKALWTGRVISALVVLMLTFSGVMKLLRPAAVVDEFARLGYPDQLVLGIGILELACVLVYFVPRTAVLGAILLTGYLGGAVATHLRIGDPFVGPVIVGALVWIGLYLRDDRLRRFLPLRNQF
jgi:DoxX-like family